MRLTWDSTGERRFEIGIDRGVLYIEGQDGVAWSGLVSVSESPSGGSAASFYLDGKKYLSFSSPEEFNGTIEAYTYPEEFSSCDGSSEFAPGLFIQYQSRRKFGLSYRTLVGNDVAGTDYGYKIHIIYNVRAAPTGRDSKSLSDQMDVSNFSWDITALPEEVSGYKGSPHFVVDTTHADPGAVTDIENILYGDDENQPRMPTISEMINLMAFYEGFSVTDNGDGTFTVTGPDPYVVNLDADRFQVNWASVIILDGGRFEVSSS